MKTVWMQTKSIAPLQNFNPKKILHRGGPVSPLEWAIVVKTVIQVAQSSTIIVVKLWIIATVSGEDGSIQTADSMSLKHYHIT